VAHFREKLAPFLMEIDKRIQSHEEATAKSFNRKKSAA
jgi:hypothetical protein